MSEKLQKVLARAGLGSRRELEGVIKAGKVRVNGIIAKLGDRVDLNANIRVNDKAVNISKTMYQSSRVIAYHKPVGEICTRNDEQHRPTVYNNLPKLAYGRWVMVGRLDINTSGLLLFTNDGHLANKLMHPTSGYEREYAVRVCGAVNSDALRLLQQGIQLEDGMAKFDRLWSTSGKGANHWYHVILKEGRNRIVRRLWESQGIMVSRLIRVRFGPASLPRSLKPGTCLELDSSAIAA